MIAPPCPPATAGRCAAGLCRQVPRAWTSSVVRDLPPLNNFRAATHLEVRGTEVADDEKRARIDAAPLRERHWVEHGLLLAAPRAPGQCCERAWRGPPDRSSCCRRMVRCRNVVNLVEALRACGRVRALVHWRVAHHYGHGLFCNLRGLSVLVLVRQLRARSDPPTQHAQPTLSSDVIWSSDFRQLTASAARFSWRAGWRAHQTGGRDRRPWRWHGPRTHKRPPVADRTPRGGASCPARSGAPARRLQRARPRPAARARARERRQRMRSR
jgi:hypothetical protein